MLERATSGIDVADATARQALAAAEEVGDPATIVHVLANMWLIQSVAREHVAALATSTARCAGRRRARLRRAARERPRTPHLHAAEPRRMAAGRAGAAASPASSACAPGARTAPRGPRRRCCGTGSASGTTRWPSWARMPPTIPGWSTPFCASAGPRCWSTAWPRSSPGAGKSARRPTGICGWPGAAHREPQDRENQDFLVAAHALALEQSGEIRQAMLRAGRDAAAAPR